MAQTKKLDPSLVEHISKAVETVLAKRDTPAKPNLDPNVAKGIENAVQIALAPSGGQPARATTPQAAPQVQQAPPASLPVAAPAANAQAQQQDQVAGLINQPGALTTQGQASNTQDAVADASPLAPETASDVPGTAGQFVDDTDRESPAVSSEQTPETATEPGFQPNVADKLGDVGPGDLSPEGVFRTKSKLIGASQQAKDEASAAAYKYELEKNEAEVAQKERFAAIADQYQQDVAEITRTYRRDVAGQMAVYKKAVDDYAAINPDPWADRSTGFTIASALAMGMSQMGMGIAGKQGPNPAVEIINQARDRDLQIQRMRMQQGQAAVGQQESLLEAMYKLHGNEEQAMQAAQAASHTYVQNMFDMQLARIGPDKAGADFLAAHAAHVEQTQKAESANYDTTLAAGHQKAQERMGWANLAFKERTAAAQLEFAKSKLAADAEADAAKNQKTDILGPHYNGDNKKRNELVDSVGLHQSLERSYSEIEKLIKDPVAWNALDVRQRRQLIEGWASDLFIYARKASGAGANLTGSEEAVMKSAVGLDTATLETLVSDRRAVERFHAAQQRITNKVNDELVAHTDKDLRFFVGELEARKGRLQQQRDKDRADYEKLKQQGLIK